MELLSGVGSSNLIAYMRAECDVHSTYEGDNTVLMISVGDKRRNNFLIVVLASSHGTFRISSDCKSHL